MRSTAPVIGIRELGALDFVQALLRQGISVRIQVSGDSMRPLLKGGETVELAPLAGGKPKLGDILFFCDKQGNPIVHRLIWRRRRSGMMQLLTKGDACAGFDGFLPAECVLGRVERIRLTNGQTEEAISLQTPFMRLQACLIVSHALGLHAFRRLKRWNYIAICKNFPV